MRPAMPTYEYECVQCGHDFEDWSSSMSKPKKPPCPKCDSKQVERRMSVFAAREGMSKADPVPSMGCGRCGDPNGPCGMN